MQCRIACRRKRTQFVVHVSGRLEQGHVGDLLAACAQAARPTVELDGLHSVDGEGIDALLRIQQQGARLVALPDHLRTALEFLQRQRGR